MSHTVMRGAEFALREERGPNAPECFYGAACVTCEATSGWAADDTRPVGVWALTHAQRHGLAHDRFRVTTQRHWRVDRVRPCPAATTTPAPPPRAAPSRRPAGTTHHARPRRRLAGRGLMACAVTVSSLLLGLLLVVGG